MTERVKHVLHEALGDEDFVLLLQRQREIALRYGEHAAVERLTASLVELGVEASDGD